MSENQVPVPPTVRQLTWRAVLTGMLVGGTLSAANIYSGLKIGFTTNMSIASALTAFGLWYGAQRALETAPFQPTNRLQPAPSR